jgi:hypothetical protein
MPDPNPITPRAKKRLRQLHAMMGSSNAGECANARAKILEWLERYGKTWNDLAGLLHDPDAASAATADPRDASAPEQAAGRNVTALDLIRHLHERYVALEPHECVAVTLWIAHTFVFDRYVYTPRLLLTSPVRGCGKTTLLDVIGRMAAKVGPRDDHITAAAIRHDTNEGRTVLIDEADNLELNTNYAMKSLFNGGYKRGGRWRNLAGGRERSWRTFAPLAIAAIGKLLPPLMSRSIHIGMVRRDDAELERFDPDNVEDLNIAYALTLTWAHTAAFNTNPPMPAQLRGRTADNWRVLIGVADACSPAWGAEARDAALAFGSAYRDDEDLLVQLLVDIRQIFTARNIDRIFSKTLVEALVAIDDAPWSEFRGVQGTAQPRPITQHQLAAMLRHFGIRPRSIWPPGATRSAKGYRRAWFEAAWRSYGGSESGSPAEPMPISQIPGNRSGN